MLKNVKYKNCNCGCCLNSLLFLDLVFAVSSLCQVQEVPSIRIAPIFETQAFQVHILQQVPFLTQLQSVPQVLLGLSQNLKLGLHPQLETNAFLNSVFIGQLVQSNLYLIFIKYCVLCKKFRYPLVWPKRGKEKLCNKYYAQKRKLNVSCFLLFYYVLSFL